MGNILANKQINFYNENGYLYPIKVISPEESLQYRKKLEEYELKTGHVISGNDRHKSHLLFRWVYEIVNNKIILDAVEDLLGPNILCWSTNFFIKEPKDNTFVSWHQDAEYWGLEPNDVVTAWIALSDATIKTGPMEVIPKSHKWKNREHEQTFKNNNLLSRGQEIKNITNINKAIAMPLLAGEISLHHVKLAHSSKINKSNDRRIGIAIRYASTAVKQKKSNKDSALLVRGKDNYLNFTHEKPPKSDNDVNAIKNHKTASELHAKILMK
mgnify:FL=1